jgi:isocitrate/isopropylmalate dehydrogenase
MTITSAPGLAGKDVANPASLIGSAAMLLAWLGEQRGAAKLSQAAVSIEERCQPHS